MEPGLLDAAARGAIAAGAAAAAAGPVAGLLGSESGPRGRLAWALLLLPLATPPLLVGYAWLASGGPILPGPFGDEAVYVLVLALRGIPLAALALRFAPEPPVSREAIHCHRLLHRERGPGAGARGLCGECAALWARGPGRARAAAAVLVFLQSFAEFEMAAILGRRSWTVSLFDAQTGGFPVEETLRRSLLPLAVELALWLPVLVLLLRDRRLPARTAPPARAGGWRRALGWGALAAAAAGVTLLPLAVVARGAAAAPAGPLRLFTGRQVAASLLFAAGAAGLAWIASGAILGRRAAAGAGLLAALPGLLGSLALSLGILWLFQRPILAPLYDTPLPLLLALSLLVFPWLLVLRLILEAVRPSLGLHAGALLAAAPDAPRRGAARALRWEIAGRALFWAAVLAFLWAWFDVTAPGILLSPGMATVFTFLHNQAHYTRSPNLSGAVAAAIALPLALAGAARLAAGRLAGGARRG